jgi:hypothetical protein
LKPRTPHAGRGEKSLGQLIQMFRNLCDTSLSEDGLMFDPDSVKAEVLRELRQDPGARVKLTARLSTASIPLQVDVGYGDAVHPEPVLTGLWR